MNVESYRQQYSDPDMLDTLPPHLYKISCRALCNLRNSHSDQTIVVTGESGAGKTEAVKLLLTHIATLSKSKTIIHTDDSNLLNKVRSTIATL